MYAESRVFKTSDGVELYNVIVKPEKEGRFPIVLLRSPYNQPYDTEVTAENYRELSPLLNDVYDRWDELVQEGYALVYQHIRGIGNSGGKWEFLVNEDKDGYETMLWLRTQDFYDGTVFRWGGSYLGWTAMMDVYRDYEDLKGIALSVPASSIYRLSQKNGFFSTGMMGNTGAMFAGNMANIQNIHHTIDSWRAFPQKDWCEQLFGQDFPMISEHQKHPQEDDPYWREAGTAHTIFQSWETLKVPVLLLTAWYDHSIKTTFDMWERIPLETRKKSAIFVTPFSHSAFNGINVDWPFKMEGATKNDIAPRYMENWFNFIRGKEPLENLKLNQVTYFPECGQNVWYSDPERLLPGEEKHTVYLNSDRTLNEKQGEVSEVTYFYNPYNPPCFYGGAGDIESGYMRPGTEKDYSAPTTFHNVCLTPQDPPNWRYDVVSFEGKPFEKKTFLKGGTSADIYVKSDCEDTCFYVRMYVVKDGVPYAARQDITSLCYQLGDYTPGTEVKLHFDFSPIVWALEPGDSLRLDIASACYPMYSVHTNVKGLQCEIEKPKCANNTVVFGKSVFHYCTSALSPDICEQVNVKK